MVGRICPNVILTYSMLVGGIGRQISSSHSYLLWWESDAKYHHNIVTGGGRNVFQIIILTYSLMVGGICRHVYLQCTLLARNVIITYYRIDMSRWSVNVTGVNEVFT